MKEKYKTFRKIVWSHYNNAGRHTLPWRKTRDPYQILVSELMLQQTQVDRVIPKYKAFLERFATVEKLAAAPLGDVLRVWQGLGYNRRAKYLHAAAKKVVECYNGNIPKEFESLVALPGIGPYTAAAVSAFAFNRPIVMIETNIRTVYLHHFLKNKKNVSDKEISTLVEDTVDEKNPREWYAALMDYGTHLKKTIGNENIRSRHYTKQSAFKGSMREIRGAILRELSYGPSTEVKLYRSLGFDKVRLKEQIAALLKEGFLTKHNNNTYTLQS